MITSEDILDIKAALEAPGSPVAAPRAGQILDRLVALLPQPKATVHCTRCGRVSTDPQNDNCDMQPCHFA